MLPRNYWYFVIIVVLVSLLSTLGLEYWYSPRLALILGVVASFGIYLYYFNTMK